MKMYEYQGRDLLASFGIPVPPGRVVEKAEDAPGVYSEVTSASGSALAVVKAQVHAGGRGKAGFVRLVRSPAEAGDAAKFMLNNRMVSPQTPPEGLDVGRLLVAAGVDIADRAPVKGSGEGGKEEFYLAITVDRRSRRNVLIASRFGGVEIEQVAHDHPEAIIKEPLDPLLGLQAFQARKVAFELGFKGKQVGQAVDVMLKLGRLFVARDCSLAEINPLVITPATSDAPDGKVVAIDAKFAFDDNGLFRHKDLTAVDDHSELSPGEIKAAQYGLSYVPLDGTIGCLVNGAGLAMATMDIIKLHGGEPANFLDVGGSATEEAVTQAFGIILGDAKVKGVLVNIFGGIMRCDVIAHGIINAAHNFKNADGTTGFKVPLVVRLEGTNVRQGRELLEAARSSIPTMQAATDLGDAAKRVCAAVG
jgi:succinyl-CoA synthetase beta subunit